MAEVPSIEKCPPYLASLCPHETKQKASMPQNTRCAIIPRAPVTRVTTPIQLFGVTLLPRCLTRIVSPSAVIDGSVLDSAAYKTDFQVNSCCRSMSNCYQMSGYMHGGHVLPSLLDPRLSSRSHQPGVSYKTSFENTWIFQCLRNMQKFAQPATSAFVCGLLSCILGSVTMAHVQPFFR